MKGAAEMQQSGLAGRSNSPALVSAAIARPAGRPKIEGVVPRGVSRTRSEQNPIRPDRRMAIGAPSGAP